MSISIKSPQHSFIQFSESDDIVSCNFPDLELCIPVYEDNDVAFQFVLETDTQGEAADLCDLQNNKIAIGLVEGCGDDFMIEFNQKPERYRIGIRQILYNWSHGLPQFTTVIGKHQCFRIKIIADDTYSFCSNCFQRISNPCHTSVIEYGNEDNFAGFNYCNSSPVDADSEVCEPRIIPFTNLATLVIPYTAELISKFSQIPTVQVWIYDEQSILVDVGIRVSFDTFPPTQLRFNFGGQSSGIIKIS